VNKPFPGAPADAALRTLLELSPDAVFVYDARRGCFVAFNDEAARLFGRTREQLRRSTPLELSQPVQRDGRSAAALIPELHRRALRDGPQRFEWTYVHADGRPLPARVHLAPLRLGADEDLLVATVTDLSDLVAAQRTLREREAWFRGIFEASHDPIFILDPRASRIVDANPAAARLLGYDIEDLRGLEIAAVHPGEMERMEAFTRDVFREGHGWTNELSCLTRGGERVPAEIAAAPVSLLGVEHMVAVVRDIRARRAKHEDDLRAQREALLDAVGDGVLLVDLDCRVVFANPAALEQLATTAEALLERSFCTVLTGARDDPHSPAGRIEAAIASGEREELLDLTFVRGDGTTFTGDATCTPYLRDRRRTGAVISFRSVEERRRLERDLRHAQKMQAVGRLAGGIAHDFNNLLTGILGSAELALASLPASHEAREDLEAILRSARTGASLTRRLLQFGRRDPVERVPVDLNEVAGGMAALLRPLLGVDIELALELAPDLPPVLGDPASLDQVLMNLAVNARDAMPEGGRLTVRSERVADGRIALEVTDTGVGMSDDELMHIFEPFYTTKESGHGTGLGLASVYGVVERMGGEITVSSTRGEGTTIRIVVPPAGP